eukprot:9576840-Karenia_brevis.AAC.1
MGGKWKRSDVLGFSKKHGIPSPMAHRRMFEEARAQAFPTATASCAFGWRSGNPYMNSRDLILHHELLGGPLLAKLKLLHGVPNQSAEITLPLNHPLISWMMD